MDALNELLYAELLAVKRTLGAEHEASIIRAFRDRVGAGPLSRQQVRGAVILLALALLCTAWRLWRLP